MKCVEERLAGNNGKERIQRPGKAYLTVTNSSSLSVYVSVSLLLRRLSLYIGLDLATMLLRAAINPWELLGPSIVLLIVKRL